MANKNDHFTKIALKLDEKLTKIKFWNSPLFFLNRIYMHSQWKLMYVVFFLYFRQIRKYYALIAAILYFRSEWNKYSPSVNNLAVQMA
jgi:hypothetical protein